MKKDDKLFKSYWNENDPIVKPTKHNNPQNTENSVISAVKESKKQYYENYFQKHSTNVKKTWDAIKSIITLKAKGETSPNSDIKWNYENEQKIYCRNFYFFVNLSSNF